MTPPLLLTGGTGALGRLVVPLLREAGCPVRVLSRHRQDPADGIEFVTGDLATGEGVAAAVAGVGTIVHCAGSAKGDADKARTLVRAAAEAGAQHLVYISVVGAGRIPIGYFAAKGEAERIVADSGLPWTTLRATQLHDLTLLTVSQLAKMPVIPVPVGFRFQPVDSGEVAARLVELSLGEPAGPVPDIAGPRVYEMDELVRSYLRSTHRRRLIMPIRVPGRGARALRSGANLAPEHAVGQRTWEDFLAERVPSVPARSGR